MNESADIPTWVMALIALVFFGGLGAGAFILIQRRKRALEALARRRGMTFHDEFARRPVNLPEDFIREIERGPIVRAEIRFALEGEIPGVRVAVCELLRYRTRSGGGERGHYALTVLKLEPDQPPPAFRLEPRRRLDRLRPGAAAGLAFGDSPGFTRRYRLTGDDEAAVRAVFTPEVRRFFERRPGWQVRSYGPELVMYRPVGLLRWSAFRAGPVERLLDEAEALAKTMERGPGEV